jgi:hypothetical protein
MTNETVIFIFQDEFRIAQLSWDPNGEDIGPRMD